MKPSVRAKAKTGNMVAGKAKGKTPARGGGAMRRPRPVGGAGEVKGHLVLNTPTAEEASAEVRTEANMVLAWGDEQTAMVRLGEVDGRCSSIEPSPGGPAGREHHPLWTVSCTHASETYELYILQSKSLLAVVRGASGTDQAKGYKPVRRVPLHPAAKLVRSDEPAPEVQEVPPPLPGRPKAPSSSATEPHAEGADTPEPASPAVEAPADAAPTADPKAPAAPAADHPAGSGEE